MGETERINPQEARAKAEEMRSIANNVESLLNEVSKKMKMINDEQTEMYDGYRKPSQLRAELEQFIATFNLAHEQIVKSAGDIIAVANTMENQ